MSSNIEWTKKNTLRFIVFLKQHPAIWNIKCKDYKNRKVKNTSLEAMEMGLSRSMNCIVKKEDIMKKMHTLKSQFQREIGFIKAAKNSGADGEVYTPRLWCFNELGFLAEGDDKQTPTANILNSSRARFLHPMSSSEAKLPAKMKLNCAPLSKESDDSSGIPSFQHKSPGGGSLEKHVERHKTSQQSPSIAPSSSGTKRAWDVENPAWSQCSTSEYPFVPDPIVQMQEEEEEALSTRSHEETSQSLLQSNYFEEDQFINSEWNQPQINGGIPKMRADSDNVIGAAYEELAKFKRLFLGGVSEPKEHDQFGLGIAEELRYFKDHYYVSLAKLKIREALFEIQKKAFHVQNSKKSPKTKPPPPPPPPSQPNNYEDHPRDNNDDNSDNSRPNKRRAMSYPEDQTQSGAAQDSENNEFESIDFESVVVKDEDPDLEMLEEEDALALPSDFGDHSPFYVASQDIPSSIKDQTEKIKTSIREKEIIAKKHTSQSPYVNISNIVHSSSASVKVGNPTLTRTPASVAMMQQPQLNSQQHLLLFIPPTQQITNPTLTVTTTATSTFTSTTNSNHCRPKPSSVDLNLTSSLVKPSVPDPPRLNSQPFETIMVKEEHGIV